MAQIKGGDVQAVFSAFSSGGWAILRHEQRDEWIAGTLTPALDCRPAGEVLTGRTSTAPAAV